jgi:hypothetical protein
MIQEPVKYHREYESGNRMLTAANRKGARQAPLASIDMASTGQVNTGPTIVNYSSLRKPLGFRQSSLPDRMLRRFHGNASSRYDHGNATVTSPGKIKAP